MSPVRNPRPSGRGGSQSLQLGTVTVTGSVGDGLTATLNVPV